MQERTILKRGGSPALNYGILFGILLGAFQIVLSILTTTLKLGNYAFYISILGIVVALIVYLLAGRRAAQETGRVGTGAFAGMWTGIVSVLLSLLVGFLLASLHVGILRQQASATAQAATNQLHQAIPLTSDQLLLATVAIAGLISIILALVIGLIFGAIGGMIGRGRASRRTLVAQERTYHDVPTPPQGK